MALPLEAYALIGDTYSAALVGKDGSIDWLCWPRFDSDACFAALLGTEEHGRWRIAPSVPVRSVRRRYRPGTLVLETDFETADGRVRLIDFMPVRNSAPDIVRIVQGLEGHVPLHMELAPRFGYGDRTPWLRSSPSCVSAKAGPDATLLRAHLPLRVEAGRVHSDFTVAAGEQLPTVLTWFPSHEHPPHSVEAFAALDETCSWWRQWSERCVHVGPWREHVVRSLITLKALTYSPTGGIVAAPTTSVPELLGGVRNWDYRYCWLRDATLALLTLLDAGYTEEARAWRDWLLRAVAGEPSEIQIMYGVAGERRLTEMQLTWLPGYEGSGPVRIGNAAVCQHQLDVFGEVMDCLHQARRAGVPADTEAWDLQRHLLRFIERAWEFPDEGIWEVRGGRQHFTHSKVMAWVAVDRAVKSAEQFNLEGPLDAWRALRARIHAQVCERGFDSQRNAFVQAYGSKALDASLLMIPLVGFLPPEDPRVHGTLEAIQRELCHDGLVHRYDTREVADGLPPGEGVFLACTFWLADNLSLLGRKDEAREIFERLLGLCNDVGLLSEEYDVTRRRLVGNFPQAFSHLALITTAQNLSQHMEGPGEQRGRH
ncbi:glycoside hydrolase family 15 protein [Hyalangium rubrum]|uniref:Glycoside hydrolase family 15 protein n=1 Tax=Hyalangium rubrum TaxID=3103134 RepID=A0ABU5HDF1_9BACT|nr:glycoside hydrolase family 15 protein [Hyalangium sp. s54d21]MDY7231300.1 glycoside hydrolase family 15 protein [Hyalangium sp. s54d21]